MKLYLKRHPGISVSPRISIFILTFLAAAISCSKEREADRPNQSFPAKLISESALRFVKNVGQTVPEVKYHVEGAGHTVLFRQGAVDFNRTDPGNESVPGNRITLSFPGSNNAVIIGLEQQKGTTNYYTGDDPSGWFSGIPTYGGIEYKDLYRGIDMRYLGEDGTFKNEFHVAPGADPGQIRLRYEGVKKLKVTRAGDLEIRSSNGTLVDAAPVAWQDTEEGRKEVKVQYRVAGMDVGFRLGRYREDLPLVIDPEFSYVTYFGGNDYTEGTGAAMDKDGYLLIAGDTRATDFPTADAFQDTSSGSYDAFVVKMDTSTGDYLYATYFGGGSFDFVNGFAVDKEGNAYISGKTYANNYPVTGNAYQQDRQGLTDGFIAKFSPEGALIFSTLIGGNNNDEIFGMEVSDRGEIYVTGETKSTDFPINGAQQTEMAGESDIFVSRISAGGDSLLFSTYLGGSLTDIGHSIALDSLGNMYLTGETSSDDFPVKNAFQATFGGTKDAFITKFTPSGNDMVYSTYLGGVEQEIGYAVAADTAGNAYIGGYTNSGDFPLVNFAGSVLKSVSDERTTGKDAFLTSCNEEGSVRYSCVQEKDGTNSFRSCEIVYDEFESSVVACGSQTGGFSIQAFPGCDYSQDDGNVSGLEIFNIELTQYFFADQIHSLGNGIFLISAGTEATLIVPNGGHEDPNPGEGFSDDCVVMTTPPARLEIKIIAPNLTRPSDDIDVKVVVTNVSDVDAYLVHAKIDWDAAKLYYDVNEPEGWGDLEYPIGELRAGESKEFNEVLTVAATAPDLLRINGTADGINTDVATGYTEFEVVENQPPELVVKVTTPETTDIGGDEMEAKIEITNTSNDTPATGVELTIGWTGNTQPIFIEDPGFDIPDGATEFTINIGDIAPGETTVYYYYFEPGNTAEQIIEIRARAVGTNTNAAEDQSSTNTVIGQYGAAMLELSIIMPGYFEAGSFDGEVGIRISNVSDYVDAENVELTIGWNKETYILITPDEEQEYDVSNNDTELPVTIGLIGAGETVEEWHGFHVSDTAGMIIEIQAEAKGSNTNPAADAASASSVDVPRVVDFVSSVFLNESEGNKKSVSTGAVDLWVNDSLVVNDIGNNQTQNHQFIINHVPFKVDITESNASGNSDPLATFKLSLRGPDYNTGPVSDDHFLILVQDQDSSMHIFHKVDIQSEAVNPSMVDLFIVHGADAVGGIDLRLVEGDNHSTVLETLLDNVDPDSVTDYLSLTPGIHFIEVSNADNSEVYDVVEADLSSMEGKALAAVVIPKVNPDQSVSATLVLTESTEAVSTEKMVPGNGSPVLRVYPNPFTGPVTFTYILDRETVAELSIFNLSGQKIRTLVNGRQPSGTYRFTWDGRTADGSEVPGGLYLYRLKAGDSVQTGTISRGD